MRIQLQGLDDARLLAALQALTRCNLKRELQNVRAVIPPAKKEILPHQAALLHILASEVPADGGILEIGTNRGYSAAVMALATQAVVTTLEPDADKASLAVRQLAALMRVHVLQMRSQDYLRLPLDAGVFDPPYYDLIFVDGDHNRIREDMPWFNRVKVGGLFLCDDYSPIGSTHPSPIVYQVLNEFAVTLDREPDVLMVDAELHGTIGFYRREGETW